MNMYTICIHFILSDVVFSRKLLTPNTTKYELTFIYHSLSYHRHVCIVNVQCTIATDNRITLRYFIVLDTTLSLYYVYIYFGNHMNLNTN